MMAIKKTPWASDRERTKLTSDYRLSAKLVPTFADRGCRVISMTDPYGPNLCFFRPEQLLFLSSNSSIVVTRLSDPVPDPLLLRKSGGGGSGSVARNSNH
jgi:hypothetical protein